MTDQDKCISLNTESILEKALRGRFLTREEIEHLLRLKDAEAVARVFRAARTLRERYFGSKIFLYGFIYFSTFCRNDCRFCASRISNSTAKRYRKTGDEVIEAACLLAESGIHLIDLTMGEDPLFYDDPAAFDFPVKLVHGLKTATGLPVMVSPGMVPRKVLVEFVKAGADWFACYQETHNRRLFSRLRPHQDYDERLSTKAAAKDMGMLIEEGIMIGVGETLSDVSASLYVMHDLAVHQARVMSFVPQAGTPMSRRLSPPRLRELLTIAVMRLLFPNRLIPASLDVDALGHFKERLDAGANVITSLIPPHKGLSGVSQPSLGIDEGLRTARGVKSLLEKAELAAASAEDYRQWMMGQKRGLDEASRSGEAFP